MKKEMGKCVEISFENADYVVIHDFDENVVKDQVYNCYDFRKVSLVSFCGGRYYDGEEGKALINWDKVCMIREIQCEDCVEEKKDDRRKKS